MENQNIDQKEMIEFLLDKGIFVSPEFFMQKTNEEMGIIFDYIKRNQIDNMAFFEEEMEKILLQSKIHNTGDINSSMINGEEAEHKAKRGNLEIIFSYDEEVLKKRDIQDFVAYFNSRYKAIRSILMQRQEMQNITSLNRLKTRKESGNATVCGLILNISVTKNDNIIITLEDPTDTIKILFSKSKPEVYEIAKTLVEDEVIGVIGTIKDNFLFANTLLLPDIPASKELKKCPGEAYAIFISDVHIGSKLFMEEEFKKLMMWLSGEVGNDEQKKTANLVKYVFITGDLIDGVGIYPKMENDLKIMDIEGQYEKAAEYLEIIPKDKHIIICPGNHDAMRIAEPQLKIPKRYAPRLYEMENVTMVSNPSILRIHKSEKFEGFEVLMYHGYSYDYYYLNVNSIRLAGGMDKPDIIMKFLLKRRHLAPTYKSTQIIPDTKVDNLVIMRIPDFFVSGHVHRPGVTNYRGVSLISSSCFQLKTDFQEKVGHNPQPGRVPLVNLQTREVKMLRFF